MNNEPLMTFTVNLGHVKLTPDIQAAFRGELKSEYGETNFFTASRFKTGDPPYR